MVSSTISYPTRRKSRAITATPALAISVSLTAIALFAFAVHAPLLLMELPATSDGANLNMFFAKHYADNWFNPWNQKWLTGFSQTTFPPLAQQAVALVSRVMNLVDAYMMVQLAVMMLLPIGMFRFARLWVADREARLAAVGSIFLGSLALLVYQIGDPSTVTATMLLLNAVAFFYAWIRRQSVSALIIGLLLTLAAASADCLTALFGLPILVVPVAWLALTERTPQADGDKRPVAGGFLGVLVRTAIFALASIVVVRFLLAPFWDAFFNHSVAQMPLNDGSHDNFLFHWGSALNFWLLPMGAMLLALPFIFMRGLRELRLLPLFLAFYISLAIGLGGTTPVAGAILGRQYANNSVMRFTFWATLLALPLVGIAAAKLLDRYGIRGAVALAILCVSSLTAPMIYLNAHPNDVNSMRDEYVIDFMNRDQHDHYRYLTLGFGTHFARVGRDTNGESVDGDYGPARLLPELQPYGSLRLDNARNYGAAGMEALRAVLKHANQYGLKYIFVRDRYYEPLIAFAGWRQVEEDQNGNVTLWSKEDVPTFQRLEPPVVFGGWQRLAWGIVPLTSCLLGLILSFLWPESRRSPASASHSSDGAPVVSLREAK